MSRKYYRISWSLFGFNQYNSIQNIATSPFTKGFAHLCNQVIVTILFFLYFPKMFDCFSLMLYLLYIASFLDTNLFTLAAVVAAVQALLIQRVRDYWFRKGIKEQKQGFSHRVITSSWLFSQGNFTNRTGSFYTEFNEIITFKFKRIRRESSEPVSKQSLISSNSLRSPGCWKMSSFSRNKNSNKLKSTFSNRFLLPK